MMTLLVDYRQKTENKFVDSDERHISSFFGTLEIRIEKINLDPIILTFLEND